ncbi:LysR family transcriptional regulator [Wenxinia saemankumensis]|uniref:Transcriptional regulator, LysR family n=1 Tax=Wenxinia saemankumensis TaxID=1447782 RepID=A0A1M6EVR8_9RHOB|nr:LysR family transcriptional regulator [Wenxinia saemankumensis]SHI89535.1 transcriptional regulator, LysR family [Wenxinia saemankumensis]
MDARPAFDWNRIRAFLATAETGSFSAAARRLGQTQPTLGRQVAALEEELDVVLFERVGRALVLTPTGRDLLADVRAMAEAADRVALAASGRARSVEGPVAISCSDLLAAEWLPRVLGPIRAAHPGLRIDVLASNAVSDLQRREADIAIRHVRPVQNDLIARLVRQEVAHLHARADLVERAGGIADRGDLSRLDLVAMGPAELFVAELKRRGIDVPEASIRHVTNSGNVYVEMVRQGLGAGILLAASVRPGDGLVPVLPDTVRIDVPYWLVTHRELQHSARIRIVWDALAEALSAPELRP